MASSFVPITYHHVGGRSGTFPLPLRQGPLLKDVHLVLYDADISCVEHAASKTSSDFGRVSIYPYCLGPKNKQGRFNINFHQPTSSIYSFNQEYSHYNYIDPHYGEYSFGEAAALVKQIEVEWSSLTECLAKTGLDAVDFLSLDVQGAEYDIINNDKTLIDQKCYGLIIESSFTPLYENQKLFPDLHLLLSSLGFELLDMQPLQYCSSISLPIGFRAQEQILFVEAVYVKKTSILQQRKDIEGVLKAAFFSLLHENIGYCVRALSNLGQSIWDLSIDHGIYIGLLQKMKPILERTQNLLPLKIKQIIDPAWLGLLYEANKFPEFAQYKKNHLSKLLHKHKRFMSELIEINQVNITPFEALLTDYGLTELSQKIRKTRLEESGHFINLLQGRGACSVLGAQKLKNLAMVSGVISPN